MERAKLLHSKYWRTRRVPLEDRLQQGRIYDPQTSAHRECFAEATGVCPLIRSKPGRRSLQHPAYIHSARQQHSSYSVSAAILSNEALSHASVLQSLFRPLSRHAMLSLILMHEQLPQSYSQNSLIACQVHRTVPGYLHRRPRSSWNIHSETATKHNIKPWGYCYLEDHATALDRSLTGLRNVAVVCRELSLASPLQTKCGIEASSRTTRTFRDRNAISRVSSRECLFYLVFKHKRKVLQNQDSARMPLR